MRRLTGSLALIWVLHITPHSGVSAQVRPHCRPDQTPQFPLALASLKAEIGPAMGEPIECEHTSPEGGDVLQRTTRGLAIHSGAFDRPAFTNGHDHWALTPGGVAYWTGWHAGMAPPGTVASGGEADPQLQPPAASYASVEAVTVVRASVPAPDTLTVGRQGSLHELKIGADCPGAPPALGQVVFTRSPGAFAAAGSM